MSILPTDPRGSNSSSSKSISIHPNSKHGFVSQSLQLPHDSSQLSLGSLQISKSSLSMSDEVSGSGAPSTTNPGYSSQKVNEERTPNGMSILPQRNTNKQVTYHSDGRGGHETSYSRGKLPASNIHKHDQEPSKYTDMHGSGLHSSGKKSQMTNGNYLLNFRFDPISRSQSRIPPPPPRRQRKVKTYNKDLFLQANYKFVVLDSGNFTPEMIDPDQMLRWEDIICVTYSTPHSMQCPICLEYPLCPQITSCGHIFCFPCILRYLLMGQEDHKGDSWKKCPLCFIMISSKELYTIFIEHVKNYCVSDTLEFMLLTRRKDSNIILQKYEKEASANPCSNDEAYNLFSKFKFTSDVDLSVRKAISDLDSWLVKADSGAFDDLEMLPYVCAAMEQLERRKKYWNEHKDNCKNKSDQHMDSHTESCKQLMPAINKAYGIACHTQPTSDDLNVEKIDENSYLLQTSDMSHSMQGHTGVLSSSLDDNICLRIHLNGSSDVLDQDLYNFYQAADGQNLILHPLNMKCLLHHYGNYDMLPERISGKILQLETVTQSEAIRRRYRYLSHFSLTTTFQLCEIDLSEILPFISLSPFVDEIKKREKQRKRLYRKEQMEKDRAEAEAATAHSVYIPLSTDHVFKYGPPEFSINDFEALGNSAVTSSSPPTSGERLLFSSVAKLGFAATHDSPALKFEGSHSSQNVDVPSDSSGMKKEGPSEFSTPAASWNIGMQSFASVTSRDKSIENLEAPKMNESVGKKGKKPSRVLLSTSGGRRY